MDRSGIIGATNEAALERVDRPRAYRPIDIQQEAELEKGGGVGRLAFDRAFKPRIARLRGVPALTQRDRKHGVDLRIVTGARGVFKRRNGVLWRGLASAARDPKHV